jgi:EmrB/QacA subfamily drug resistance transporter
LNDSQSRALTSTCFIDDPRPLADTTKRPEIDKRKERLMHAGRETADTHLAPESSQFYKLFPSIAVPMFLAMLDQTIITTALPSIVADLGQADRVSWVVVSYLVAATLAAPIYGRIADYFGRRRLLFMALAIFVSGALCCALSTSILVLAFARILQGFGGGGLMTLSQALIGEGLLPRDRAKYQGYLATAAVSANALGPLLGAYLTQHFGWQYVFLIDIPLGALAALLLTRLPGHSRAVNEFRFDGLGLLFFSTSVVAALLSLEGIRHFDPRGMTQSLTLALIGVLSLICLIYVERRAKAPLIPIALLRQSTIWRCNALAACHGGTLVSLLTFLPLYMRVVRGASISAAGMLLLPFTIFIGLGSLITGRLVSKTGWAAPFPSGGLVLVMASLIVLAVAGGSLSDWQLAVLLAVNALFMGSVMGVVQVTVQTAAGPSMIGAAAGSVQFSRSIGAALGTSIVATIFFAALTQADPDAARLLRTMLQVASNTVSGFPSSYLLTIQTALAHTFRLIFLVIAGFAAMGALLAWLIPLRRI